MSDDQVVLFPQPGTVGYDKFVEAATKNPNSVEAKVLASMMQDAQLQAQQHVRDQLTKMISLAQEEVPGQLFRDVSRFHQKFDLAPTADPGHALPDDVLRFRLTCLLEEVKEYAEAVGYQLVWGSESGLVFKKMMGEPAFSDVDAVDALADLTWFALGTAHLHRFLRFNEHWTRIRECNMAKVQAKSADDPRGHRSFHLDVVKPDGWRPPIHADLLEDGVSHATTK
jgi:predicted HAD superfamily Cof-like phosphohydrolase